jgi:hypothetical protein
MTIEDMMDLISQMIIENQFLADRVTKLERRADQQDAENAGRYGGLDRRLEKMGEAAING